jgi:hypothetical protein
MLEAASGRRLQWRSAMQTGNFLAQVREGMRVYDRLHNEIGTVERVQMSDDNPATEEVEAVTPGNLDQRDDSLIDNIAEAFAPDELPEEVRERLLQRGFIRIDSSGLFAADRYVTPDQIMSVSGDALTLKVSRDELMRH